MDHRHRSPSGAALPDSALRELADRAAHHGLSRRAFLGFLSTVGAAGALGGCAAAEAPTSYRGLHGRPGYLRWANWSEYLDTADDPYDHPTLTEFDADSGIKVLYREDIEDNDQFFAKVCGRLANNQDCGYDLVTVSDWMVERWLSRGYAHPLDRAAMPNTKNLLHDLEQVDYDPGRVYTMPWQSGFTGIAWNKTVLPNGLGSVTELWKRADLHGKVSALSNIPDTIGLIMLSQGVDPSGHWGETEFAAALAVVQENLDSNQLRPLKGTSYIKDLLEGVAVAGIVWSGDMSQLNQENEEQFEFRIPDEGGMLWSDNLLIPSTTDQADSAQKLINFYYDPVVAATVAAWVVYITPVNGAQEAMKSIDKDLAEDPLIFPDEATLANTKVFRTLSENEESTYGARFRETIGTS